MRRPLCVFCAGTLGLELVCAFLPQTGHFVPFAAFFIAGLLWALAGRLRKSPAWGYGICLILGAALGLVLTGSTQAKWDAIQTAYDGRSVLLEAEVESTSSSYFPGRVRAVLRVETVDREAASFRVECASLPTCSPGDRVKGRFALEMSDDTARLNALADGIALNAAYEKGFAPLGQSTSFRARTARLQKRLSAALRQGMASGPAGVLAPWLRATAPISPRNCAQPTGARGFPMCWWSAECTFRSCAAMCWAGCCPAAKSACTAIQAAGSGRCSAR